MRLVVRMHTDPVGVVDARTGEAASVGRGLGTLSLAWDEEPGREALRRWLDDCLPENGQRSAFLRRAAERMEEYGYDGLPEGPSALLWGNAEAEYAGAVSFAREEDGGISPGAGYAGLNEREIEERLREASRTAERTGLAQPGSFPERRVSLSGMRPKIGLTPSGNGWRAAMGGALNLCIVKLEDDRQMPGEAGVEAICQRAAARCGLEAARTVTRTFGAERVQTVVSYRSDRCVGEDGAVEARHQEEFSQACGWPGALKYEESFRNQPGWPELYRLVTREEGRAAVREAERVTGMLAFAWLVGHSDLHRRNVGIAHVAGKEGRIGRLAPLYDVSSSVGNPVVSNHLAIGVGGRKAFGEIRPPHWVQHAKRCRLDPEETLQTVRGIAGKLPGALEEARDAARDEDDNREQSSVDRRMEQVLRHARGARERFERLLEARARRRANPPGGPSGANGAG